MFVSLWKEYKEDIYMFFISFYGYEVRILYYV